MVDPVLCDREAHADSHMQGEGVRHRGFKLTINNFHLSSRKFPRRGIDFFDFTFFCRKTFSDCVFFHVPCFLTLDLCQRELFLIVVKYT